MADEDESLFIKTGEVLPKMVQMKLITEIECRIIASADNLIDRQAAVYKVMASKLPQNVANVVEMLQVITSGIQNSSDESEEAHGYDSDENEEHASDDEENEEQESDDDENEENTVDVIDKNTAVVECHWVASDGKHPLLIESIVQCIFEYLPFSIIKEFRLVCKKWNLAGELLMRKRGIIHFKPDALRPETFLETFRYSDINLPISAFKISSSYDSSWRVSELEKICATWGNNIKELRVDTNGYNINAKGKNINVYDVTPWIVNMPNLENLNISSSYDQKRRLLVQWNCLGSIKFLKLSLCNVLVDRNDITKLKPLQVSLDYVDFKPVKKPLEINMAELLDFSKATQIKIRKLKNVKVDLTNAIFNVQRLYLNTFGYSNATETVDWEGSRGHINLLELDHELFLEKPDLEIKQLVLNKCTIDLCALPQSLEKLYFFSDVKIVDSEPTQLPNLNLLRLDDCRGNENFSDMKYFKHCMGIVELQLQIRSPVTLNLCWVPRSVKKLYIDNSMFGGSDFEIVDDTNRNELDTVIFETSYNFNILLDIAAKLVSNIKNLKVLVLSSNASNPFANGGNTFDIMKFVDNNQHLQKIVIGWRGNGSLHKSVEFITTLFSTFVDKESNFYVFEKRIGKAIGFSDFQKYGNMIDLKTRFCKQTARCSKGLMQRL